MLLCVLHNNSLDLQMLDVHLFGQQGPACHAGKTACQLSNEPCLLPVLPTLHLGVIQMKQMTFTVWLQRFLNWLVRISLGCWQMSLTS